MKFAIVGRKGLGGVSMRGVAVAEALNVPFYDLSAFPGGHFDAILLCKYHEGHAKRLRAACDVLIWDPLDCWESDNPNSEPCEFWQRKYAELQFDDALATSPACAETIAGCVPECLVHLLPHHSDPKINAAWHDPKGPVVYAGAKRFIERHHADIERACRQIGRQLVVNHGRRPVETLRGAALHLHPRFPQTDSPLNRLAKPQVKVANAAAANCPILATPHPCFTTLKSGGCQIDHHENWERLIMRALESDAPARQPTLQEHAEAVRRVVGL